MKNKIYNLYVVAKYVQTTPMFILLCNFFFHYFIILFSLQNPGVIGGVSVTISEYSEPYTKDKTDTFLILLLLISF